MIFRVTGKLPAGRHKQRILQSVNYKGGVFKNLTPTSMIAEGASYGQMVRQFFKKHPGTVPKKVLPSVKTNLQQLPVDAPVIVWFGHSSYLIKINNKHFLVDPVFSDHASPFSFLVKAFPGSNMFGTDDLPLIDGLILTHDHYDHLDYTTIMQLKTKVSRIYCSLGISAHLDYWGFDTSVITEMDWWDEEAIDADIKLIAAPARHFSGRGFTRAQSLWSSFILRTTDYQLYLGGDSGYDFHFEKIGKRFGPFDIALLEAGQYNSMWPTIHMMPEETVQAAVDLQAKSLMPVHWAKFKLGMHAWNEPVKRVLKQAAEVNMDVVVPKIGQPVIVGEKFVGDDWWNF